ncbi:MAG: methyltransferase domain-containing protein [Candidatus Omnitrophica bacterium]|nr:methyltransferase domain-containing protein [Candidatus Omnitrophota bacterium]
MKSINKCRVCGHKFFEEPLLRYENMPGAAQFLPDAKSLKSDKGVDLEVCQCSGCGLVQLSNDPVPYYREVIRAAAFSGEMKEFRIKQFGNFIEKYSLRGKKVIEMGCGRGEYLSIMQQAGAEAYGLEHSEESVMHCVKNGLRVSKGFVENSAYRLNDAPFDAFYILNFLEHLPNPNATLKGIYNNLTDDCIGLVEVPNFDMILRKKLFSEFISDHLFYFTKETLSTALRLNGFEVIYCREIWYEYIISAIVKKRKISSLKEIQETEKMSFPQSVSGNPDPVSAKAGIQRTKDLDSRLHGNDASGAYQAEKLDISDFYEHQAKLKNEVEEYIRRFKKVAIWGAGHQALAVISLLNLADKIKYVVDSALFKQGKYTPATHIPIVSPDTLDSNPMEAVIIMSASYSDEVAGILRQKFDRNIKIAILRDYGLEIL